MQLHADQPIQYRPSHLHTSKTFLFPTVELFQLARNTDIIKKKNNNNKKTKLDTCKMCPIPEIRSLSQK